jgi:hypothetical protein
MSSVRKILGQSYPAAATPTDVYTVPTGKQAVVSTFTVCNQSTFDDKFSIAIIPSGEVLDTKHIVFLNQQITGEDTFVATIGICLNDGDMFQATSTLGTCSFMVTGQEITQ